MFIVVAAFWFSNAEIALGLPFLWVRLVALRWFVVFWPLVWSLRDQLFFVGCANPRWHREKSFRS